MEPIKRSKLQELENEFKRAELLRSVKPIYEMAIKVARKGYKEVFLETIDTEVSRLASGTVVSPLSDSVKDIKIHLTNIQGCVDMLKELFPDSKVELLETWVEVYPGNRVLKRGVLIDWS